MSQEDGGTLAYKLSAQLCSSVLFLPPGDLETLLIPSLGFCSECVTKGWLSMCPLTKGRVWVFSSLLLWVGGSWESQWVSLHSWTLPATFLPPWNPKLSGLLWAKGLADTAINPALVRGDDWTLPRIGPDICFEGVVWFVFMKEMWSYFNRIIFIVLSIIKVTMLVNIQTIQNGKKQSSLAIPPPRGNHF